MTMKGLVVVGAILLLAQNINAESNTRDLEKTDRVIVEIEISEKKIFYVDTSEIGYTRDGAKAMCGTLDMTMVTFESASKWLSISKWLAESPYSTKRFWTESLRDADNATWYWEKTGDAIVDFFWAPNQPDVSTVHQGCMTISAGGWEDEMCADGFHSVFDTMCEF